MFRVALSLLPVLAACAAPEDAKTLLPRWGNLVSTPESVRFDVEIQAEDGSRTTFTGARSNGEDLTVRHERAKAPDYRAVRFGTGDMYLQHPALTLPPDRVFAHVDVQAGPSWVRRLGLAALGDAQKINPRRLIDELDPETAHLMSAHDGRYVLNSRQKNLTVHVDERHRPVRIELRTNQETITAVFSDWGKVPEVLRPQNAAEPHEVVVAHG